MSGSNKKHGRNKVECKAYRDAERAEKAKARKLHKHILRTPWDSSARHAFANLPARITKGMELPPLARKPSEARKLLGITLTQIKRDPHWRAAA